MKCPQCGYTPPPMTPEQQRYFEQLQLPSSVSMEERERLARQIGTPGNLNETIDAALKKLLAWRWTDVRKEIEAELDIDPIGNQPCDEPVIVGPRPITDPSVRQGDLVIDNDGTVVELT